MTTGFGRLRRRYWARNCPVAFPPVDAILTHKSRAFNGLGGLGHAPGGLRSRQEMRNNTPAPQPAEASKERKHESPGKS
jgi:hypothetical protein